MIYEIFHCTNCADELFIQSLVYHSDFKDRLFDQAYDDDIHANMRLIDMKARGKNGNPYTWRIGDWAEIRESDCLFARKFNSDLDGEIIEKVVGFLSEGGCRKVPATGKQIVEKEPSFERE